MESWSEQEVYEWIVQEFNEETARVFEEQEVDGETLMSLGTCATMDQLICCGLKTVKQQLKLKRLVHAQSSMSLTVHAQPTIQLTAHAKKEEKKKGKKLSRAEINGLPPEEKRVYLMMRNKVMKAAKLAWPGNDVPLFKGDSANLQKLDRLVEQLRDTCCTKHFGEEEIRLHIIDTMAERRRHIKNGFDYDKPPAKKIKREQDEENGKKEEEMSLIRDDIDGENRSLSKDDDIDGRSIENDENSGRNNDEVKDENEEIGRTKKTWKNAVEDSDDEEVLIVKKSKDKRSKLGSKVKKVSSSDKQLQISSGTKPRNEKKFWYFQFQENEEEEESCDMPDPLKELSMMSAEAIVLTAFGAHFVKEVSRSQLESAAKSLLSQDTIRQLKKGEKGDFIVPLAEALLKRGTVKLAERADLKNLARDDIKKVGPF